jgi:hypothetical protein
MDGWRIWGLWIRKRYFFGFSVVMSDEGLAIDELLEQGIMKSSTWLPLLFGASLFCFLLWACGIGSDRPRRDLDINVFTGSQPLSQHSRYTFVATATNNTDQAIVVESMLESCSCVSGTALPFTLEPHTSKNFPITFSTGEREGPIQQPLLFGCHLVETGLPFTARASLKCEVRPDITYQLVDEGMSGEGLATATVTFVSEANKSFAIERAVWQKNEGRDAIQSADSLALESERCLRIRYHKSVDLCVAVTVQYSDQTRTTLLITLP